MLPILSILQIVDLGGTIVVINTTRVTILILAIIKKTMVVNHKEKSVIFLAKKVVTLINN